MRGAFHILPVAKRGLSERYIMKLFVCTLAVTMVVVAMMIEDSEGARYRRLTRRFRDTDEVLSTVVEKARALLDDLDELQHLQVEGTGGGVHVTGGTRGREVEDLEEDDYVRGRRTPTGFRTVEGTGGVHVTGGTRGREVEDLEEDDYVRGRRTTTGFRTVEGTGVHVTGGTRGREVEDLEEDDYVRGRRTSTGFRTVEGTGGGVHVTGGTRGREVEDLEEDDCKKFHLCCSFSSGNTQTCGGDARLQASGRSEDQRLKTSDANSRP
uniref:Uncharacterized protein n=1 Tax=Branchiostoma floridae TaxID=7739 RepID=C3Y3E0_BRAFL|eukprot:XP_002609197.1 hypothetical protein BRAFLDRAFT_90650 [Branchiostoma floridae]